MTDAINPSHYKKGWSNDAELISITENLTGNGAQAVQYVARSTRLDETLNKSKDIDGWIEDLNKAAWFIAREILRLKALKLTRVVKAMPKGGYATGGLVINPIPVGPAVCDIMVHNIGQDHQGKPIVNQQDQLKAAKYSGR